MIGKALREGYCPYGAARRRFRASVGGKPKAAVREIVVFADALFAMRFQRVRRTLVHNKAFMGRPAATIAEAVNGNASL